MLALIQLVSYPINLLPARAAMWHLLEAVARSRVQLRGFHTLSTLGLYGATLAVALSTTDLGARATLVRALRVLWWSTAGLAVARLAHTRLLLLGLPESGAKPPGVPPPATHTPTPPPPPHPHTHPPTHTTTTTTHTHTALRRPAAANFKLC